MDEWVKIFQGVDIATMIGVAVFALVIQYGTALNDRATALVALSMGALMGGTLANTSAADGSNLVTQIMKGAIMSGGAAAIAMLVFGPKIRTMFGENVKVTTTTTPLGTSVAVETLKPPTEGKLP